MNSRATASVNVENMTEDELKVIQKYYRRLSDLTSKEENLQQSHSIDEAELTHEVKKELEDAVEKKIKDITSS